MDDTSKPRGFASTARPYEYGGWSARHQPRERDHVSRRQEFRHWHAVARPQQIAPLLAECVGAQPESNMYMSKNCVLLEEPGLRIGGIGRIPQQAERGNSPLIVAVHGGGYCSRFFDLPGYSLIDRAVAAGCGVLALDRPGHGLSTAPDGEVQTLTANAQWIRQAIDLLWPRFADRFAGIVLVGHSIGSAVVIEVAAGRPEWPLQGVAVSGVGLTPNAELGKYWENNPDDTFVDIPPEVKDFLMFGPAHTVPEGAPDVVRMAQVPVSSRELVEINTVWIERAHQVGPQVMVPVFYRLGEYDALWKVGPAEANALADIFTASPDVNYQIAQNAGHCIDFHHPGRQFQAEQVEFAVRCGSLALPASSWAAETPA